jgi:4,5-dihydroxyphthalate decarboxylase
MGDIKLTLACGDYEHTRDLALGRVRPQGIDLTVLNFNVEQTHFRFFKKLEWEVSELSMGMYTSAFSAGDRRIIAIPVFTSRVFRQSAFYVRTDSPIRKPEDLAGKRVGIPKFSQTAIIYALGYLSDTVGIPLSQIKWFRGGISDPGRVETVELRLPSGIDVQWVQDRTLTDMLLAGDIDALITARAPRPVMEGDPRIRRLFPDYPAAEQAYFQETGIFPIMHTIAIRREAYEANRWIARNLMTAFTEAKERSVARMREMAAASIPLPWVPDLFERAHCLLFKNGEYWPYGVDANRRTLAAFLRFGFEQGVFHRLLQPEEIFAEETLSDMDVKI